MPGITLYYSWLKWVKLSIGGVPSLRSAPHKATPSSSNTKSVQWRLTKLFIVWETDTYWYKRICSLPLISLRRHLLMHIESPLKGFRCKILYTLRTIWYSLYTLQTAHTTHFALHIKQGTLYTTHHTTHYTQHISHYKQHTPHSRPRATGPRRRLRCRMNKLRPCVVQELLNRIDSALSAVCFPNSFTCGSGVSCS